MKLPKPRSIEAIVDGSATAPVRAGWAMGSFYDRSSPFFSPDFEVKIWGPLDPTRARYEQPAATNPDWFAHEGKGPELVVVMEGEVSIDFGELSGEAIQCIETRVVRAGETITLPEGLYRRFRASHVRAITVRRAR